MRIRSQLLNRLVGCVGAMTIRAWSETLDIRVRAAQPSLDVRAPEHTGDYLYVAWHEAILGWAFWGMSKLSKAVTLISQHQDGEYIDQIIRQLGASTVRGSSTRGGRAALREIMRIGQNKHLGITPDGPRGPRRHFQSGAVYIASRTGLPIVPMGFGFTGAWRANSWDKFAVPAPFSSIRCVIGDAARVPESVNSQGLEVWRGRLEQAMLQCTHAAEAWASGGETPDSANRRLAA